MNNITNLYNCRACDYTILDEKLVHIYFSSLPEHTQRSLGVATLNTCKTVSEMYNIVKQTAIMVTKQQRVINRDVVNINSLHMSDPKYNYNNHSNYNNCVIAFSILVEIGFILLFLTGCCFGFSFICIQTSTNSEY